MEILTLKTFLNAFRGKDPVRSMLLIYDTTIEQVSLFLHLGYDSNDRNIDAKIARFN